MHLGEAPKFLVYGPDGKDGFVMVESRSAPARGMGERRWLELAQTLKDCRAVLVSGAGRHPPGP